MTDTATAAANWVNYVIHGEVKDMRANSCHGCGNAFYSYSTEIARYEGFDRRASAHRFVVSVRRYSPTTSRHMSRLVNALRPYNNITVDQVEGFDNYHRPYEWRSNYFAR